MGYRQAAVLWASIAACCAATPALAAPEEIQVYEDELDKPHQFGLDIHNSYVAGPDAPLNYPGEQDSTHRYRFTPEFSYGIAPNLEAGLYLPLASVTGDGVYADGVKVRLKYILPHPQTQSWYVGANFEIGRVGKGYDINPWNAEFKGIAGWRKGPWDLAVNANIDFTVSGPKPEPASVQLATKLGYKLSPKWSVGVESYNGMGTFKDFMAPAGQGHSTFLVADGNIGLWGLNLGVGHGYSGETDRWIFKFILSVPIDG